MNSYTHWKHQRCEDPVVASAFARVLRCDCQQNLVRTYPENRGICKPMQVITQRSGQNDRVMAVAQAKMLFNG
jgi:hypothetical protein